MLPEGRAERTTGRPADKSIELTVVAADPSETGAERSKHDIKL